MENVICQCGAWLTFDPRARADARCPKCGRDADGEEPEAAPMRAGWFAPRIRRGQPLGFREALAYPLADAPGIAFLVVFPPLLAFMSVPVFDLIKLFTSGPQGGFNPLAILIVPFSLPLFLTFMMTFGYVLLYLGRVLIAGSMGETDHPRYPFWDRQTILEGVGRWLWAVVMGLGVGAFPILLYWLVCGDVDLFDRIIFAELLAVGAGYAQMVLAASILHDTLAAANPVTVLRAIFRIGWDYVWPSLTAGFALMIAGTLWILVIYHMPTIELAALGLWGFWIVVLYEGMVVMRVLGWCYYRNGAALGWFKERPRWGAWENRGRIYSNS